MGVYIKGMEMPTSCPCELLGIGYDLSCSFAGGIPARVKEYYECCQNGTRPSWCPLVPVPPHGRLIDANALYTRMEKAHTDWREHPEQYNGVIPVNADEIFVLTEAVIIPAEEGE